MAPIEMRPAERHVAAQRLGGGPAERDEALLASLAGHAHDAPLEVDARLDEPDGLRDAEPGAVEELDERTVACGTRRRPVRGLDETLGLGRGEGARNRPRTPGPRDRRRRVVRTRADQGEMAEVCTDGRESAGDRRGRSSVGAHRREPGLDLLGRRGADRVVDRRPERREVAPVRVDGARRAAGREEEQVALDIGVVAVAHRGGTRFGGAGHPPARRVDGGRKPGVRHRPPSTPDNADCVPIRPQPKCAAWRRPSPASGLLLRSWLVAREPRTRVHPELRCCGAIGT